MGDGANSALIGLLVSALFFGISLATVLSVTDSTVKSASAQDDQGLTNAAHHVLDLIIRSPGIAGAGGSVWQDTPDDVKQIGLAVEGRPNLLHPDKVAALRSGGLDALANGFLDYPEAKEALALEGVNFHLRTFPALRSVEDSSWTQYRGFRVAYVGHFEVESSVEPVVGVSVFSQPTGNGYTEVAVTITYFDGPSTNLFQVTLDLDTGQSRLVENFYTPLMAPGGDYTLRARYYDVDWSEAGNRNLRVTVTDAATATKNYDNSTLEAPLTEGSYGFNLLMEPSRNYFHGNANVKLILDKAGGDGRRFREEVQAFLTITDPVGAPVVDDLLVTIPKTSHLNYPVDFTGHPHGTYTATLVAGTQTVENRFTWTDDKLDSSAYVPSTDNLKERGYIASLFANFYNVTYYSGVRPADVYRDHMDDTSVLGETLADTPNNPYDILIVGSRITQSQLQGQFPNHVLTFVQNGGTLIALGADDGDIQWMKNIFGAGVATATGGISTPDPTAPILHSPEELAYQSYDDRDRAYKIDGNDRHKFTHVLVKDSTGNTQYDTMAISNPGAYGGGTVIVTSYIPNEIFGQPSEAGDREAKKLLHNLVAQAFQILYIDYGPPIPTDSVVGSASRLGLVGLPKVPDSAVEVRFVMYVFR